VRAKSNRRVQFCAALFLRRQFCSERWFPSGPVDEPSSSNAPEPVRLRPAYPSNPAPVPATPIPTTPASVLVATPIPVLTSTTPVPVPARPDSSRSLRKLLIRPSEAEQHAAGIRQPHQPQSHAEQAAATAATTAAAVQPVQPAD